MCFLPTCFSSSLLSSRPLSKSSSAQFFYCWHRPHCLLCTGPSWNKSCLFLSCSGVIPQRALISPTTNIPRAGKSEQPSKSGSLCFHSGVFSVTTTMSLLHAILKAAWWSGLTVKNIEARRAGERVQWIKCLSYKHEQDHGWIPRTHIEAKLAWQLPVVPILGRQRWEVPGTNSVITLANR